MDVYFGDDLDKLLARADIDAVVVCLPIDMLPKIVLTAFAAGKHVLSEKPVSPTVKSYVSIYSLLSYSRDFI